VREDRAKCIGGEQDNLAQILKERQCRSSERIKESNDHRSCDQIYGQEKATQ